MVELVDDGDVELFHDSRGRPFATIRVADHQETWPVDSTGFNRWLRFMYFRAHGCAVPAEKQKAAIELFAARAEFEGSELPVGRRVAGDLERIVIDLGDPAWRAVEVTRDGWTVVERPDTRFQREAGMLSLPSPGRDGSLDGLRTLFNAAEPDDWTRVLGALIGAFHPTGPYLVRERPPCLSAGASPGFQAVAVNSPRRLGRFASWRARLSGSSESGIGSSIGRSQAKSP